MKVHKFTVYMFDDQGFGPDEAEIELNQMKHWTTAVFPQGSAEIGEWHDDHPLNKSGCTQLTFEEFFR